MKKNKGLWILREIDYTNICQPIYLNTEPGENNIKKYIQVIEKEKYDRAIKLMKSLQFGIDDIDAWERSKKVLKELGEYEQR